MKYSDESGELFGWDDLLVAIVGGTINWASNGCQFNKEGLAYFGTGAVAGVATYYGGPFAGAAVMGAGNNLTQQVSQNGWGKVDWWGVATSSAFGVATAYVGGQISSGLSPYLSKFASNISGSPVIQGAIKEGLTYTVSGFTLSTGMALANGEDLNTALKEGGKGAWQGLQMGLVNGVVSGYKYAIDKKIDPWNGEKIQMHHSDPLFAGGDPNQQLTRERQSTHQKLHSDMNDFLYKQRDAYGNHMRPQSNNSGEDIRNIFGRSQLRNSLKLFYDNNKWTYPRSRYDFYRNNNLKWWPW